MIESDCRIGALFVHPVKSCAAVPVDEALLIETGLEFDRAWMVVDEQGDMLTQRELPRLALVKPTFRHQDMVLRAPGMLALHLALDAVEAPMRVRVWSDEVRAYDMGALAAQWFTDLLGRRARVVRFDPDQKRLADPRWTGALQAESAFSDGFALLVTQTASLNDLNRRLAERGAPAAVMERFRPNLVLEGLQAYDEDHVDELQIETADGTVVLRLVKPCTRCTIPNVDPASGTVGHEPGDTLAGYRADARVGGGITFGMNAVPVSGIEHVLRVGQPVRVSWRV